MAMPPSPLSASKANQNAKLDSRITLAKPQRNSIRGVDEDETDFTSPRTARQATRSRPAIAPLPWASSCSAQCQSMDHSNPPRKQIESSLRLLHSKIRRHRCAPVLPVPTAAQPKHVQFTDLGHQQCLPATAGGRAVTAHWHDHGGTAASSAKHSTPNYTSPGLASDATRHRECSTTVISCRATGDMKALLAHDSALDSPVSVCAPLVNGHNPFPLSVQGADTERYSQAMDATTLNGDGQCKSSSSRIDAIPAKRSTQLPPRTRARVREDEVCHYVARTMQHRREQLCVPLLRPFGESLTGLELESVVSDYWIPRSGDREASTSQSERSESDYDDALGHREGAATNSGRWRLRLSRGRGAARKVAPDIDESTWRRVLASFPSNRGSSRQRSVESRELYGCNVPG